MQNVILRDTAERPQPLSPEIILNRKFIERDTQEARAPFLALDGCGLLPYLRAGAISIDAKGRTQTAPERLADYCTLYAETPQQAAFVAALERMQKAAAEMSAAYTAALETLPAQGRKELSANAGFYLPTLGALASLGQIPLTAQDAAPRALITLFGLAASKTAPKFYNLAGIWDYTAADANALLGCNLAHVKRLGIDAAPRPGAYPAIL